VRSAPAALACVIVVCLIRAEAAPAPPADIQPSRITLLQEDRARSVPRFGKLEIAFTVDTTAEFHHWPYDAKPPAGISPGAGITATGVFVDPHGREYSQPAFYYQQFEDEVRNQRDWHYPTATFTWRVRFSPNRVGHWKYRILVQDRQGIALSGWRSFSVEPSSSRGFVRVSRADSRYFEFEDGTFFSGLGVQIPEYFESPTTDATPVYRALAANGINFARLWVSSLYGSAWTPLIGGRNRYAGYLPVAGLMPFVDAATGETTLTMRMDFEPAGDIGWFDACRLQWSNDRDAVKPHTRYRIRVTYRGSQIAGPRRPQSRDFGLVAKLGGMFPACYEPGTSRPVTGYGLSNDKWANVEGIWNSGNRYRLPKLHLALENVRQGAVYVRSVSIRELLTDGSDGPEVLARPSMEYQLYIPQARAYAMDQIVALAERSGVYLKLVVMDTNDEIYQKISDDGSFVTDRDNRNGIYATGRAVNKTRWLQQAWWRYLQARWGYSPSIHSWEFVNEGDPASRRHYEAADEFGKFMHYGAFGNRPDPSFDHPNDHLVTTSLWHSYPAAAFWGNAQYSNIDYADLHAYVSTSFAPRVEKEKMQWDAAYYHTWHSQAVAAARIGKPVVRGEAGLDAPARQDEFALGLQRDRTGVWLHNYLWSGLHSGALYEVYWWRSHIWGRHGDHRPAYRLFDRFVSHLSLNKGGYADWNGTVTNPALRVVGQKNTKTGMMHLWIQNSGHTWKNVADLRAVAPLSGEIRVPGFAPNTTYAIEWWDTWAGDKVVHLEPVTSEASGLLTVSVKALQTDVALMLSPMRRPTS
jgi:hypothetical protein